MYLGLVSKGKLIGIVDKLECSTSRETGCVSKAISELYMNWVGSSHLYIYKGEPLLISCNNVFMEQFAVQNKFLLLDYDNASENGSMLLRREESNDSDDEYDLQCTIDENQYKGFLASYNQANKEPALQAVVTAVINQGVLSKHSVKADPPKGFKLAAC